ncbi:hypothetical protein RRG08_039858 [Elysia crispata]|uniref:Uncharacterized protein n=1 Tax=Elysia crispata TaxID=231223 RepID=A0AAE0ZVE6_9GAST|nr:hypothetical protein RRG08_039858 [Elysia crispata]
MTFARARRANFDYWPITIRLDELAINQSTSIALPVFSIGSSRNLDEDSPWEDDCFTASNTERLTTTMLITGFHLMRVFTPGQSLAIPHSSKAGGLGTSGRHSIIRTPNVSLLYHHHTCYVLTFPLMRQLVRTD